MVRDLRKLKRHAEFVKCLRKLIKWADMEHPREFVMLRVNGGRVFNRREAAKVLEDNLIMMRKILRGTRYTACGAVKVSIL